MSEDRYTAGQRRAYAEGKAARKEGKAVTDNPYPAEGFDEHPSWNAGFGVDEATATNDQTILTDEQKRDAEEIAARNAAITARKEAARSGDDEAEAKAADAEAYAKDLKED